MTTLSLPALPAPLAESGIALRAQTPDDAEFLTALYFAARWHVLEPLGWPAPARRHFLAQQLRMQTLHYATHYPGATQAIVEAGGAPAGRLCLCLLPRGDLRAGDLRIIDIALMPAHRGRGLGGALIRAIQTQATGLEARQVSLHVEQTSPAVRLYRRLGFTIREEHGPDYLMVWPPAATP